MYLIRQLRARGLRDLIANETAFYDRGWTPSRAREWQLEQFNRLWEKIREEVPYYYDLYRERGLPPRFSSWEEFQDRLPPMERATVREAGAALRSAAKLPDAWRSTGGSTAEPVQVPVWGSELDHV